MRIWILCLLLLIAVLIEATLTTIPVVFLLLINFLILEKKSWVFAAGFFSGLMLDIFSLRFLGSTSLFFVTFLFVISLYERKFETTNPYFVLFASFIGTLIYLIIFNIRLVIPQAILSALIGVFIFYVMMLLRAKEKELGYKYRLETPHKK